MQEQKNFANPYYNSQQQVQQQQQQIYQNNHGNLQYPNARDMGERFTFDNMQQQKQRNSNQVNEGAAIANNLDYFFNKGIEAVSTDSRPVSNQQNMFDQYQIQKNLLDDLSMLSESSMNTTNQSAIQQQENNVFKNPFQVQQQQMGQQQQVDIWQQYTPQIVNFQENDEIMKQKATYQIVNQQFSKDQQSQQDQKQQQQQQISGLLNQLNQQKTSSQQRQTFGSDQIPMNMQQQPSTNQYINSVNHTQQNQQDLPQQLLPMGGNTTYQSSNNNQFTPRSGQIIAQQQQIKEDVDNEEDDKEVSGMFDDMNILKDKVLGLLDQYKKEIQSNNMKQIKKQIKMDSQQVQLQYANFLDKYNQNVDISIMSNTQETVLTNITGISKLGSVCKGSSKKEKEINTMMNLVEEFLQKFNKQSPSKKEKEPPQSIDVPQQQQRQQPMQQQQNSSFPQVNSNITQGIEPVLTHQILEPFRNSKQLSQQPNQPQIFNLDQYQQQQQQQPTNLNYQQIQNANKQVSNQQTQYQFLNQQNTQLNNISNGSQNEILNSSKDKMDPVPNPKDQIKKLDSLNNSKGSNNSFEQQQQQQNQLLKLSGNNQGQNIQQFDQVFQKLQLNKGGEQPFNEPLSNKQPQQMPQPQIFNQQQSYSLQGQQINNNKINQHIQNMYSASNNTQQNAEYNFNNEQKYCSTNTGPIPNQTQSQFQQPQSKVSSNQFPQHLLGQQIGFESSLNKQQQQQDQDKYNKVNKVIQNQQLSMQQQQVQQNTELQLYCPKCDQYLSFQFYFGHIDECDKKNKPIQFFFDESFYNNEDAELVFNKLDKKIEKIKNNLQQTLPMTSMPMTQQILLDTIQNLSNVLTVNNPKIIKSIIKKIDRNLQKLQVNKNQALGLYQYLNRVTQLLKDKSVAVEQSILLNEISAINKTNTSIFDPSGGQGGHNSANYNQQQLIKKQQPQYQPMQQFQQQQQQQQQFFQLQNALQNQQQFQQPAQQQFAKDYQVAQQQQVFNNNANYTPQQSYQQNYMMQQGQNYKVPLQQNQMNSLDSKHIFYELAGKLKKNLPELHHGHQILIADLYKQSMELNLNHTQWEQFIIQRFNDK